MLTSFLFPVSLLTSHWASCWTSFAFLYFLIASEGPFLLWWQFSLMIYWSFPSWCQTEALLNLLVPHYHFPVPQRPQLQVNWEFHGGTQRPFAFPFHAQLLGLLQLEVSTPLKTYFQVLKWFNQQQKWFQPSREVNFAALLSWFLPWLPLASWAFSTLHQVRLAWSSLPRAHHHLHPCCMLFTHSKL